MNIFNLASKQLEREGLLNKPNEIINLIDRAVRIRKWFDYSERKKKVIKDRKWEIHKSLNIKELYTMKTLSKNVK